MKRVTLLVALVAVVLMQGCAGFSERVSESIGLSRKIHVKAVIDGSDYLKVQGKMVWFEHRAWRLPGQPGEGEMTPIVINGRKWNPVWSENESNPADSSTRALDNAFALDATGDITVEVIKGRGSVTVAERPSESNRYTLSVLFDDDGMGGADWYDVIIHKGHQQLRVEALIDGSDYLKIRRNNAWWQHRNHDLPGKWQGADEPTYLNGEEWMPLWSANQKSLQKSDQLKIKPALPFKANEKIRLKTIKARGKVSIAQYPEASNNYTLSVLFDDAEIGGADLYDVVIEY